MAGVSLNSISENASRLGMRLQEQLSEHTRDLPFTRGSSAVYLEGSDDKNKNIRKQLESSSDREKLDAMKRLIALISKGRNVSEYFAQVVKNVASQNLEIRKLVYIYLLRYAEQEPDLALLSINTFQRDLTDSSPLIRAMALRVLSGIRVPMIGSIVVLAIKKCAADMSPYVRKAAAIAIPKCYALDTSHTPALVEIIKTLIHDPSYLSIGSVAVAFEAVCPTRLDLLHSRFRRLCKMLVDVDEWGQIDLIRLLTSYSRTMLPKPNCTKEGGLWVEDVDDDLDLFLQSAEPLLQSRNPAVVLAVAQLYLHVYVVSRMTKLVHPLLRLLHANLEIERVVLTYLLIMSRLNPHLLAPSYTRFAIRFHDVEATKLDKIKLLLTILNPDNYSALLREFIEYSDDIDQLVSNAAIQGIGRIAHLIPEGASQCFTALLTMIENKHDNIVGSAVAVLKCLIQSNHLSSPVNKDTTELSSSIVSKLARTMDGIKHPEARSCVIWLVGQYSASVEAGQRFPGIADWAPDVLRITAHSFQREASVVKLQVITLAAKLVVSCPTQQNILLLTRYVFNQAKYDTDYDVRDRCRMLFSLLAGIANLSGGDLAGRGVVLRQEQVRLVLFSGKLSKTDMTTETNEPDDAIGTLSLVIGRSMPGSSTLPDWLEKGIDPGLRGTTDAISSPFQGTSISSPSPLAKTIGQPATSHVKSHSAKQPWTEDLDEFYADSDGRGKDDNETGEEDEGEDESESGEVEEDGSEGRSLQSSSE